MLSKPAAVLFDWDNTLVNTWPIIHEALVETFTRMGQKPWSYDQTKERVRKSMRDSFPEIFGPNWEAAGEIYQKHYRSIHLAKLEALPRSEEVLKLIKDRNLFCSVVSNKKGGNLRQEIDALGWKHYFHSIVGSDDAGKDKPHGDPVHLALKDSGMQTGSDIWFIGDSDIDLECALNTGCTAILYGELAKQHHSFTPTHYHGFPYHAHVHDHTETLALFTR